ncbi:unnamed protein product, partial [Ectocarpus sp. 8 AP-2014]
WRVSIFRLEQQCVRLCPLLQWASLRFPQTNTWSREASARYDSRVGSRRNGPCDEVRCLHYDLKRMESTCIMWCTR